MASASQRDESASSVCLKHNPRWNKTLYWLLNKLFGNVIPKDKQKRVGALLCTCERRADLPPRDDPFLAVSDADLAQAVKWMDLFLITNNLHAQIDTLRKLMQWLGDEGVIPNNSTTGVSISGQRSSALKLLYILQQCLRQNYAFLNPPQPINRPLEAAEMTLTYIADCHHGLIGAIIGRDGRKLKPLLRQYKCHIKVDKVNQDNDVKIKVTIKKKTKSMETLEKVKKCIEDMVKDVVEDEERYKEEKIQSEIQYKADFRKLLEATGHMSRTASWNDIMRDIVSNVRYFSLNRAMGHDTLRQWFLDIQQDWPAGPESPTSGASSGKTFMGGASITENIQVDNEEEQDETVLKGATAQSLTSPSVQGDNADEPVREPVPSTSGTRPELSSSISTDRVSGGAQMSGPLSQPLNTARVGRLDRASVCLVHDRRWLPTYQFMLTRCYVEINLEKPHGRAFSKFVCSCQQEVPDYLQHFQSEDDMKAKFREVIESIKNWPTEVEDIVQPFIKELEKCKNADIWKSLYRFVFVFLDVSAGGTTYLSQSYRLPYGTTNIAEGGIVCQPEAANSITKESLVVSARSYNDRVEASDRRDECYFHGKKKRGPFQCVVNYLATSASLPKKYRIPFCKAVCCCHDDNNLPPIFPNDEDLRADCVAMKNRLSMWRGDSSRIIQSYIPMLQAFLERNEQLDRGFQKFVYYFNCAYKREYTKFER